MVDWKNIGVPITVALIGGTAAIITGLGGFIIGSLFVPVVNISKDLNSIENKSTIIDITNTGSASAKNLKLTIQAPVYVSFKHPIFSTERLKERAL
jgi:hypothetical protein